MNILKLEEILYSEKQPKFRFQQIKKAIFQEGILDFSKISTISKELRELLTEKFSILSFKAKKNLISRDKKSIKALLELSDGNLIETVLLSPMEDVWSACVSVQVGCQMGCRFCATGKMGFKRNLEAEEITDQILFWRGYLKENKIEGKFSNIVYMGMGEPFMNWEEVKKSLHNLIDPEIFGFGSRNISVSTSGIPDGIEALAQEFPQINLAVSLHFADNEKRSENMPINQKNNLEDLRKAIGNYFQKTNRKIFLEYVMLEGINDGKADADKLIKFVKSIGKLQLLHINLICYNSTDAFFKSSSKEKTRWFRDYLENNRISVTIRKSLGEEIKGACGQLAGK